MSPLIPLRPVAALAVVLATGASATTLGPDPAFGTQGVSALASPAHEAFVASATRADGSLLGFGNLDAGQGSDLLVARFRADGRPDPAFGLDGQSALDLGAVDDSITAGLALADGRSVVAGRSGGRPLLVAFRADGSLDTGFGAHGRVRVALLNAASAGLRVLVAGRDGRLLAAGEALVGGVLRPLLVQVDAHGALDPTFDSDGVRVLDTLRGSATAVVPETDGGAWVAVRDGAQVHVVRTAADGALLGAGVVLTLAGTGTPVVALARDGTDLLLAERGRGRLTRIGADGRLLGQQDLLADGELAALGRDPQGRWFVALERSLAGVRGVQVVALARDAGGGFVLGTPHTLATGASQAVAVRSLDASVAGRVRVAGFRHDGLQTDAWTASLEVQEAARTPAAPVATPPNLPKYCSKPRLSPKKARRCGRT